MEANLGGFGALLAAFDGYNSNWAEKIRFRKKTGGTPKLDFRGHFFTQFFSQRLKFNLKSTPQDAPIAPKMVSYG